MEAGAVWIDRQGFLDLRESLGTISIGDRNSGENSMGVGVIGIDGQDGIGLVGGPCRLFARDEHVAKVVARLDITGLKIDSTHLLLVKFSLPIPLKISPQFCFSTVKMLLLFTCCCTDTTCVASLALQSLIRNEPRQTWGHLLGKVNGACLRGL